MAIQTNSISSGARATAPASVAERLTAAALFAAGFAILFRRWLFTGFDGTFGDEGDGEILLALLEHWHRVFADAARIADPIFFYPERGTLGFTDAYFLYGLVYSALRFLGADAFTSLMVLMAGLSAIGYFGFLRLVRRHVAIPLGFAAVGAFLFAFANMNAVKLVQAQAYCAMLLPLLCDLMLSAWSAASRRRAIMLAAAAGLLHALIFFTGYQTAWFFAAFLLLLAALCPLLIGVAPTLALLRQAVTTKRQVVLAFAGAFAIGIVPFLLVYLPVWRAGHRRELAEVLSNAPDARDILNVTTGNWLWGEALRHLGITGRPDRPMWEVELGFTPAVLAVIMATTLWLGSGLMRAGAAARDRLVLMLAVAVIGSWLVQLDYFGVRPWELIFATLPGAGAVRYSFRSQIVANLFAAIVVARGLEGFASLRDHRRMLLAGACAFVLLVEQINVDWPATISRRAKTAWIERIPPSPPECRAFYLAPGAEPADKPGYEHQADAMLFSQIRGIATINGYSSWLPDDWALEEPASPVYAANVRAWARLKMLSGLCGLNPARGTWTIGLPP